MVGPTQADVLGQNQLSEPFFEHRSAAGRGSVPGYMLLLLLLLAEELPPQTAIFYGISRAMPSCGKDFVGVNKIKASLGILELYKGMDFHFSNK